MAFVLTSYNDNDLDKVRQKTKDAFPIRSIGADTKAGMKDCAEKTRLFAHEKDTNPQPQNTRSDPADRIRRFREGIGSTRMSTEEREAARVSEFYRKSLKFLLQCVLAPLYGEKVAVVALNADDLNREKHFPGRQHFVKAILDALDMGDKNILTLRNRAGRIVGLLSSAGPIPVVENGFSLPELQIDETKNLAAIVHGLSTQDKEVLAYWLWNNTESPSLLYADLKGILNDQEKIGDSYDFSKISEIMGVSKTAYGIAGFPVLLRHGETVLCDRITVVPIRNDNKTLSPFGYNTIPLSFEGDGMLYYVFLPPLTIDTIAATGAGDFSIEKIEIPEGVKDPSAPKELRVPLDMEDSKLVSITIRCVLKNKFLRQIVRRTYTGGEIRYIKNFPSLTVYGPVPMHGWIARRDIDIGDYPSPLKSGSVENITLNDIVFEKSIAVKEDGKPEVANSKLDFLQTTDKYDLYQGPIPLWLTARTSTGDTLGGLPLRVVDTAFQGDWKNMPNFVHTECPTGRLIVAADIGSSRSAILFHRSKDDDSVNNEIFIDNGQPLGIPITTSGSTDVDVNFGMMVFQPEKQLGRVEGKTPVGLLTTDAFQNEAKAEVALFNSGKLILLDPKSIADASTRKILSDIKVGNDQKAMYLLAQSLLPLIVDRAIHLECSTIELRLSYLIERYNSFQIAWKEAIKKFGERWPGITVELKMYLPESLAIANELKHDETLTTISGAAIIDIGDFTTDIALFISKAGGQVELKNNFSVQFAGRQIILQPIWDYLLFSGAKIESLYNPEAMRSSECQKAVARLEAAREKQKKEKKRKLGDDVRRDLLCLMSNFNKEKIPLPLQNLFDICYLTEIVILKRILRNEPKQEGAFDIHLFGGGRSQITLKGAGFDWDKTLDRLCNTKQRPQDGKTLAFGLLRGIDKSLESAAETMKNQAQEYDASQKESHSATGAPSGEELREAYIRFLQNAQALKKWEVYDANDNRVSTGKFFNVKKNGKSSDGVIEDDGLFREYYDDALEFAMAGSVSDVEIIKVLFAYKMAYSNAVAFYSKASN
jgi:hypothetical protein